MLRLFIVCIGGRDELLLQFWAVSLLLKVNSSKNKQGKMSILLKVEIFGCVVKFVFVFFMSFKFKCCYFL